MEYLPNDFTLELPEGTFPLSTDSMVLAHFVKLPKKYTGDFKKGIAISEIHARIKVRY